MYKESIECPECSNTLWDIHHNHNDGTDYARCSNCHYERPYHRRSHGRHMTPTQRDAVERIRHHFGRYNDGDFDKFEVEMSEIGSVIVSLHTTGKWYSDEYFLAFIGRRGAISIHAYGHGISGKEHNRNMVKLVAKSIGATIRKDAV